MAEERDFPSRLLRFDPPGAAAGPTFDPKRINQHLEGRANGKRIMSDADVAKLLKDPFATLVLRKDIFPNDLTELLDALDAHNGTPDGLPMTSSFLISEGGQIRFAANVDKGGSRLLTVRSRGSDAHLMISTLVGPGVSIRSSRILIEVIAWDPENRTFHFYQRQKGAWFWCGQSDMAFDADMRGEGPFDSHINGYPNMKELKTPWVHWHGPGLGISETAYAADDPMVADPLFVNKQTALTFETRVIRPLCQRWNEARFAKAPAGLGALSELEAFVRQVVGSTSFNLTSTHTEASRLAQQDLDDLPPTFFLDVDCLVDSAGVGLAVQIPPLVMSRTRYRDLMATHDLRVVGGSVDQPGDVPFCFTVPERALEDVLVLRKLIGSGRMSKRMAACLLMVDFPNPVDSPVRAGLLRHLPAGARLEDATDVDVVFGDAIRAAAPGTPNGSPERRFAEHWDLGPDGWEDEFADRVEAYFARVVAALDTDAGCDAIFRLAESRRRQTRRLPLLEFDLALPVARGIPENAPILEMTDQATVRPRA
jgi:hypothetical protein